MNLTGQPAAVGRHCGSNEYEVGRQVVDFYAEALGDPSPLYAKLAPPLVHHSECWVLSAREIERGPLARVKLPVRVPTGFHAKWIAGDRLR